MQKLLNNEHALNFTNSHFLPHADFVSKNSGDCDNGYSCYADPCSVSTCASAPRAMCTSNYCDGCIAEYSIGGEIVDCRAPGN